MADVSNETVSSRILALLNKGHNKDEVATKLEEEGLDPYFIREIMKQTMQLRDAKRRSQSLALILAGAFVCLMSCVLTLTGVFSSQSFPYVLYGLTSVGILLVFAGFVKIF